MKSCKGKNKKNNKSANKKDIFSLNLSVTIAKWIQETFGIIVHIVKILIYARNALNKNNKYTQNMMSMKSLPRKGKSCRTLWISKKRSRTLLFFSKKLSRLASRSKQKSWNFNCRECSTKYPSPSDFLKGGHCEDMNDFSIEFMDVLFLNLLSYLKYFTLSLSS